MNEKLVIPKHLSPPKNVLDGIERFINMVNIYELDHGSKIVLCFDECSTAYYLVCHIDASTLITMSDLEASLDGSEDDVIYKLNRDVTDDKTAYKSMEMDAVNGRSFEDMVVEFDLLYRDSKPLKVYGGQHRIRAITSAVKQSALQIKPHGIRVYFCLSKDQKVEIATINNTSIAVPNDLIDRMREQLLGGELRDWCQAVGLLDTGGDFADRKSPDQPTVRVARTLIVNFYKGMNDSQLESFHQPIVCKSGGSNDENYQDIRDQIKWDDENLLKMGKEFARLHLRQRSTISKRSKDKNAEFARKAISLAVVASWAFAAGLFQKNQEYLTAHYFLPDSVQGDEDPLNAKALSLARLKGTDPDTYRGLGARIGSSELGRMLEVFMVFATKNVTIKKITKELANAAIQTYEAKKATFEANKVLGKI